MDAVAELLHLAECKGFSITLAADMESLTVKGPGDRDGDIVRELQERKEEVLEHLLNANGKEHRHETNGNGNGHVDIGIPISKVRKSVEPGTVVQAGDRNNWGKVVTDTGPTCTVEFISSEGHQAIKEFPKTELRLKDGTPLEGAIVEDDEISADELIANYPDLQPPIIDGLLREEETANIIAASKTNKSWLALGLCMAVASGTRWLGLHEVSPGRVLYIDNELHKKSLAYRMRKVAQAGGFGPEITRNIRTKSLRGKLVDLMQLGAYFATIPHGTFKLVVIDAFYRCLPPGTDENDNAAVAGLYNTIDQYAAQLGSAFVVIHHTSKGSQAGKSVTDVGSGAGAMSRAADTHIVLRPHVEPGHAIMDAAVRSFPPFDSRVLRWNYPLWEHAEDVNPKQAADDKEARRIKQAEERDADDRRRVLDTLRQAGEPITCKTIRSTTRLSNDRVGRAIATIKGEGRLELVDIRRHTRLEQGYQYVDKP